MHIVQTRPPETIANICICLIKQTTFMLQKQMDKLEGNFLQKGGLRERMMKERLDERAKQKNGYRK
jgi:four helix bundle suffix protein